MKLFAIVLCLIGAVLTHAQGALDPNIKKETPIEDPIYNIVEQMPRFPGCGDLEGDDRAKRNCAIEKLDQFIADNLQYPPNAKANKVEGYVVLSFVVAPTGRLQQVKVWRTPDPELSQEAMRLVRLMNESPEPWTAGRRRGNPVHVRFNLPINFELPASAEDEMDD